MFSKKTKSVLLGLIVLSAHSFSGCKASEEASLGGAADSGGGTAAAQVPNITTPSSASFASNASPLTIAGACTSGQTVVLGGDVLAGDVQVPIGSLTQTCVNAEYSFTIGKGVDGTYNLTIHQHDEDTLVDSSDVPLAWVLDTVAPAAPTIVAPNANPFTSSAAVAIAGGCETGATVELSGDDSQSVSCSGSVYRFLVSIPADGTYNFSLRQTDLAGNLSAAATQQWVVDTSMVSTPYVSNPPNLVVVSSDSSFPVSGYCEIGATVTLGGDVLAGDVTQPANSLSLLCAEGTFSFIFEKLVNGTYDITVTQSVGLVSSASANFRWTRQ